MVEYRLKFNYDKMVSYNGKFKLLNIKYIVFFLNWDKYIFLYIFK